MASKKGKNDTFRYLNSYIPQAAKRYATVKTTWGGLNKLNQIDSGELTDAKNISISMLPTIVPANKPEVFKSGYTNPISMFGFKDFLLVIYRDSDQIKVDYIKGSNTYTGVIKSSGATSADDYERSVVQFNVYTDPDEILDGTFQKKILIFPDKLSMDYDQSANFNLSSLDAPGNPLPNIKKATVHLSRLFGIDDDRVYASGFNDYTMWNLDTADESLASNAWVSTTKSNTKAGGDHVAITTYDGRVIIFKRDFMQMVTNNKNPFRVVDITNIGTIGQRTVHEVAGVLYFCSQDAVYAYTGAYPVKISDKLGISSFENAVCGSYNGEYYVHLNSKIYVYNAQTRAWGVIDLGETVIAFAEYSGNLYALTTTGKIHKLSTTTKSDSWHFTTDLLAGRQIELKRLHKMSVYAKMAAGSNIKAYLYKLDGTSTKILDYTADKNYDKVLNVILRMTTSYAHKIKFEGSGDVTVYYMELKHSYDGEQFTGDL